MENLIPIDLETWKYNLSNLIQKQQSLINPRIIKEIKTNTLQPNNLVQGVIPKRHIYKCSG